MRSSFFILVWGILSFSVAASMDDRKEVSFAIEKLRIAMIDANGAGLDSLTADSLSYGHSTGRIETKKEFIESIVSGKSDFVSIELSEQTISLSGDVAVVRHILNAQTNDSGKPGNTRLKVLLVWHKEKGEWKLIARQAVKFT